MQKKVNTFAYLKSSVTVPTEKKQTSRRLFLFTRFGENTIGLSPVTQIISLVSTFYLLCNKSFI